jgi:hypothetical protein
MEHGIGRIQDVLGDGEVPQSLAPARLPLTSDAGAEGVHKHLTEEPPCVLVGKLRGVDGFHHRADHDLQASVHWCGDYEASTATSRTREERGALFMDLRG